MSIPPAIASPRPRSEPPAQTDVFDCVLLIVAYKSSADIRSLMRTVPDAAGDRTWHVVIVDNWGKDELLGTFDGDPHVTLVQSESNVGYAGGLNLALAHAPAARVTVFLNPDLSLGFGCLETLVALCESGHATAAVPCLVDEAGATRSSLRREPSIVNALGEALFGDHWPSRPPALAEIVRDEGAYRAERDVDWATGAALAVRSDAVHAVGPWDSERFFLYSEETDYFRRIRESGRTVRFAPDATVRHRGGGSGVSSSLYALLMVNKFRYFRKWHHGSAAAIYAAALAIHCILRISRPESRVALASLLSRKRRGELRERMRAAE